MRILQRYVLKEHIGPFIFSFLVITFLLVIDYVPRIIDQVLDKGLGLGVVLELVGLNLAWMLALSVPMSVLVATLMAFGRLSGDFEIIAIKSAGINLIHIITPLLGVGAVLMVLMIQFNDRILPDWNQEARLLRGDIAAMRPTLTLKSGVFIADIPGYLIQFDKIDHRTSRVEGVKISDTRNPDEPRIILADYGFLKYTNDGTTMEFTLHHGEVHEIDTKNPDNYRKLDFDTQVIQIEGAGSKLVRTNSKYRTDREMNIAQMQENVQRAKWAVEPIRKRVAEVLERKITYLFGDSFVYNGGSAVSDSLALYLVKSDAAVLTAHVQRNREQVRAQKKIMDKYKVEIYKKYSIPAASLAFILIGAPLGVLARRGGIGVAIAISIILFIIYWAFLIGGEDLADREFMSPFWAMWSANFLIGGVGLYLLVKVITERPLFAWFRDVK